MQRNLHTTFPPTIVNSTFVSEIIFNGISSIFLEKTTMPASLPASMNPLMFSSNEL